MSLLLLFNSVPVAPAPVVAAGGGSLRPRREDWEKRRREREAEERREESERLARAEGFRKMIRDETEEFPAVVALLLTTV